MGFNLSKITASIELSLSLANCSFAVSLGKMASLLFSCREMASSRDDLPLLLSKQRATEMKEGRSLEMKEMKSMDFSSSDERCDHWR